MINTTIIIPTQTPALKMPPITSQELTVIASAIMLSHKNECCFMRSSFTGTLQMLCRVAVHTGSLLRRWQSHLILLPHYYSVFMRWITSLLKPVHCMIFSTGPPFYFMAFAITPACCPLSDFFTSSLPPAFNTLSYTRYMFLLFGNRFSSP